MTALLYHITTLPAIAQTHQDDIKPIKKRKQVAGSRALISKVRTAVSNTKAQKGKNRGGRKKTRKILLGFTFLLRSR